MNIVVVNTCSSGTIFHAGFLTQNEHILSSDIYQICNIPKII